VDLQFPRAFDNDFVTGLRPSDRPGRSRELVQMREREEQLDQPADWAGHREDGFDPR
jgi:hypothetical protein